MIAVSDKNFKEVLGAPLAVVDFWSPQCPSCMKFKPVIEEAARSSLYRDTVLIVGAQVDDNDITADAYRIEGLPTTIFMRDGSEVFRHAGALTKRELADKIKEYLGV
jgi:thioredoxin 1